MSFDFDAYGGLRFGASNSSGFEIVSENRLSCFDALPQVSLWSGYSEQVENDNMTTAMALFETVDAQPRSLDSCISSTLPGELQFIPWAMNHSGLLGPDNDDCISETLPHVNKETPSSVGEQNQKSVTWLGNQQGLGMKSSFHPQVLADRVLNSIDNLRVFYEQLSNIAPRVEEVDGHGDSESFRTPQAKKQKRFSRTPSPIPNDHGFVLGDSLESNSQIMSEPGQMDASSENNLVTSAFGSPVACGKSKPDHQGRYRQSMIQSESVVENPICGIIENLGNKSKSDLDALLCSLRSLLSVLRTHEEMERISRTKWLVLREKKEALVLQKQQYKDNKHKRLRVSIPSAN